MCLRRLLGKLSDFYTQYQTSIKGGSLVRFFQLIPGKRSNFPESML
jgi:hypothetical protein